MLHPRPQSEWPYPQLDVPVLGRGQDGPWKEHESREDVVVDGFNLHRTVNKQENGRE